ncbi:tRNA (N6-threonylcarbamoyladenosine(37)-N6)-methyltransferase TrmO [Desulfosarcina alkanivorans]|jgi:tRNA-Thr(GGU) m(6)t(6)A37 methyltransferase TsaA|uniref:tRNA (N6-threonylcarbamoyladenosine(37)-N6)-methyltransferase TrmO n=1 Tax=Desulfosarcina alkanivorans TaxID=571177 RepID=A0A5K7YHG9_9BACT|nr:tRNA (N6-threonylcarbamoyladenosine(37)-N6)-methyltransferase TrmO [Desulfosarcina alkanivorans]BBO68566.1 tRNA (N6-threonylcarbamoyladenosine(37)-N6)-methyltransferase TrmO [Desulfosarcina alkanivorans]
MQPDPVHPQTMQLTPVGVVRSAIDKPMLSADEADLSLADRMDNIKAYHRRVENTVCQLVIGPQWADLLDGIEDFSHVLVLYWPHLIDPARRSLRKVHPMGRKDLPLKGIFATCSPARPNPVLVSAVPLVARKGNVLEVRGLEAVDGSPIIDVKPYSRSYLQVDNLKVADWMETIHREMEKEA